MGYCLSKSPYIDLAAYLQQFAMWSFRNTKFFFKLSKRKLFSLSKLKNIYWRTWDNSILCVVVFLWIRSIFIIEIFFSSLQNWDRSSDRLCACVITVIKYSTILAVSSQKTSIIWTFFLIYHLSLRFINWNFFSFSSYFFLHPSKGFFYIGEFWSLICCLPLFLNSLYFLYRFFDISPSQTKIF